MQILRCANGRLFHASLKSQEALERELEKTISVIKNLLCADVKPILSDNYCPLKVIGGSNIYIKKKICKVNRRIWSLNFPRGSRGIYKNGKIFLKDEDWCRKTLYHEALHSVSVFSLRIASSIGHRFLFLSEGITEFFTGYILFKLHRRCYESWKRGVFEECKISYKNKVKMWCAFCNFIGMNKVAKLYFWTGSGAWNQRYRQFLQAIHDSGYPKFRDVLALGNNAEMQFIQECIRNFGEEFKEILYSKKSLDYARIKI